MTGKAGMSMGVIYSGIKAGIVGLNKGLARELGRFATVNNVCPGPVSVRNSYGPGDRIKGQYMVTKSDSANINIEFKHISPIVAFLASDAAAAISGQSISVDGGLWLKLEI
jgi:NAD(P)-dependent dehydrogenase (short-subunit alcohol dehydrogenase family)